MKIIQVYPFSNLNRFHVGVQNQHKNHIILNIRVKIVKLIVCILHFFVDIIFHSVVSSQNIHDLFGFFLGLGITMNIIIYFLINASYVVGIFPTTGLALPFISYGGSHLILSLASMGILINMGNYYLNRKIVNYYE